VKIPVNFVEMEEIELAYVTTVQSSGREKSGSIEVNLPTVSYPSKSTF